MQSSSAYRSLRTSGFLVLPSERTLNDYIHFYDCSAGCHKDLQDALAAEAQVDKLTDVQKFVALSFDEMQVREDLVYNKNTCNVVGFVNLGQVDNQLKMLSDDIDNLPSTAAVATHVLVFMIRGITTSLRFPYAHFLTKDITAPYLFSIFWEVVRHIESIGLKILSVTCDGAAVNRKFFRMHLPKSAEIPYKTPNIYSEDKRPLFFICDVPHLLKTTRNCWSHSFPESQRRAMLVGLPQFHS